MSVTLQGATDSKVEYTDSGDRNVIPTDFESLELEGQLFARTDVSEIASGEVYFPRERVYGVGADSSIYAIDPSDGSEIWASDHSFSNGMAIAESVKGDKVFVADNNGGNVDCHDATSGSIEWTGSVSGPCESIAVDPADEAVYIGTNDGVLDAIDPADGSGLWSENIGGEIAALSAQHDGDWLIVASGSAIRRVSTADGSVDWEYTEASSALVDIDLLGDGSEAIATDGSTFHIVDTADGTQKRTFSDPNNSARTSAGPDGEAVYSVNGNTSDVYAINTSDGSTRWTNSSHTYEPEVVTVTPSGSEIVTASYDEIVAFDSTGSRSWSTSSMNVQYKVASGPSIPGKPGGKLSNALFFDVANGEEYELQSGSITIEEITDADGNELDSSDYNEPGYDTYDSQEYAEYVEEHTTYKETIYREEDSGPSVPCLIGCGDDGGDWIGLVVIGAILFMVVGWVTDLLPFVGGD
ncbi:PQQ-binding-like beta-propeller repeat protein [Halovivax ruber]|nr:PQQ-binding-like beta-propeller repeat protein [Halovivax ruber]